MTTAETHPDTLALIRAAGERTGVGIQAQLGHADALSLLYAAVIGERGELGLLVRDLLAMHLVLPGTGKPWPGCTYCHGAGEAPAVDDLGPQHCHCRCDLCMCGDALCLGPCSHLDVLLKVLVLRGATAQALDVPRALAELRVAGVRRVVANVTGRAVAIVDPVDNAPGTTQVTVGDATVAEKVGRCLLDEGFRVERRAIASPPTATRLIATYAH